MIHQVDDNNDKLVAFPVEKQYSDDAIRAMTEFQESSFDLIIVDE